MMHKKGVMDQIGSILIALVLVGIVVTVGLLIISQTRDVAVEVDKQVAQTVTNETVAWTNNSWTALAASAYPAMDITCNIVCNGSVCTDQIGTANYTCEPKGIFFLTEDTNWINGTVRVTYDYVNASAAYNGTTSVINAVDDIPGWFSIIVLILIGSILIGLVAVFRGR